MSSSDRDVPMSVHAAREGDGYWKNKGEQWQLLCPHLSSTAKIALGVLCSLTGQTHPVRRLTTAEFAGLLSKGPVAPGERPKGMSTGGAIRVLRELADLGQITRPDGDRLTITSRPTAELSICVWKRPRHDCGCARNAHDALNVLRGEPRWFPPAGAGENSDQAPKAGEDSDQSGENSDQSGQNSARTSALTCDDEAPLSSPPPFPSLSGEPAVIPDPSASAETVTEERETSPTGNNHPQVPEQRSAEETGNTVTKALAAQWRATHGTTPGRRQLAQVAADATDALTDGDTPEWLTDHVVPFMVARQYLDLGRAKTHPSCPPPSRPENTRPTAGCPDGKCDGDGIVYRDPELLLGPSKCVCRTQPATV